MTLTEARDIVRGLGLTFRHDYPQYRVAFKGPDNEASAYYADDLQDAVNTARAMAKRRDEALS